MKSLETYITMRDLYELLPIGKNQSDKLFHQIEQQLKEDGYKTFITKPRVLPKAYVMNYLKGERLYEEDGNSINTYTN